ncbi:hypothetical protein ABEP00_20150 [Heyndrickxia sporothermodurans]
MGAGNCLVGVSEMIFAPRQ